MDLEGYDDPASMLRVLDVETSNTASEIGKINVLVAGNSGVGKSTVINAVFGKRVAQTGVGNPQTMQIAAYEAANSPLRIYDTRGFEIAKAEETVSAVQNKIRDLRGQTNPNDQIHIAWTCILEQSHRIEPVQQKLLAMLKSHDVAALVLITQAMEGNEEMEASVRRLAVPNSGVIPILAEQKKIAGITIPPRGIAELVERTLLLLPKAQQAAFVAAQMARWDLKEKAITNRINVAAAAAATSSLVPIPGGHSVALLSIQLSMLAWINAYLGLSLEKTGGKDALKGLVGVVVAKVGGTTAFWMVLSEAMKFFPGMGTLGAAVVGGPIAAAITKTLGHVYFETVKDYARNDEPLPDATVLASQMQALLKANSKRYRDLAEST